ncbi:MAG: aminoacyl--tRNA ligase-related protein, partial [Solirubrobacterales bacterium]|nr:aminoacyl--tRNA ligase-related protein [Solirubrobacterales bacterium]
MEGKAKTGISPTRAEDFPQWFQSVVRDAEVAELDHVRGAMVIRPWGYGIWELMQRALDEAIKETGAVNAYFPLFIPLSYFEEEAKHVEGFAKEMAVVTHHRLEQGEDGSLHPAAELPEPLIVRPTSETIIGRSFAKWINSYRDLPLMINQWANIVRWELRPRVLLRTTEFLWQEGHTAHATEEEALEETRRMLGVYREFAESVLAIPVIPGEKPESERFPGAERSLTIEAMMQDGKALQSGTSHYLGQNFSRAMEMEFTDEDGERKLAYTTSWGLSTRMMGAVVMTHADDNGLRVPPRVAPRQVQIVPITRDDPAPVLEAAGRLQAELAERSWEGAPIRAQVDSRDRKPAEKRWEWIRKGVPVVIELGERDIEQGVMTMTRRDDADLARDAVPRDAAAEAVAGVLGEIQTGYFEEARERLRERTRHDIATLDQFREFFSGEETDAGGFVRAPWSEDRATEETMGELGVSVRCIPFDAELPSDARCVITG